MRCHMEALRGLEQNHLTTTMFLSHPQPFDSLPLSPSNTCKLNFLCFFFSFFFFLSKKHRVMEALMKYQPASLQKELLNGQRKLDHSMERQKRRDDIRNVFVSKG